MTDATQSQLFGSLRTQAEAAGMAPEVIETHISWVLLSGDRALKIKKAVDLGFLDFRTLAERRRCCEEEVRLNRRTAPAIYLGAVPITGNAGDPRVGGDGDPIEWAVEMRRFEQSALLDHVVARGALGDRTVDRMAERLADFHEHAAVAGPDSPFGTAEQAPRPALGNFEHMGDLVRGAPERAEFEALREWTEAEAVRLVPAFAGRKAAGRIRECHGDLHLGNVVLLDGEPVAFDGIEFNDEFRWIDVASDIAFLAMDLIDRGLDGLAWRLLDRWLSATGDYDALAVLRFYLAYRAMVRAKVHCIRVHQPDLGTQTRRRIDREFHEYLALASRLAHERRPALVLMQGLSGSGKTTVAQSLLERLGGVRVRSDVERKRLHGLEPEARAGRAVGEGLYAASASEATYGRLAGLARQSLDAGYPIVVDATFLRREDRNRFRRLAAEAGAPFAIAHCVAPADTLRARVAQRALHAADASDATLAVLESQMRNAEPLTDDESRAAVTFEGKDRAKAIDALLARLRR